MISGNLKMYKKYILFPVQESIGVPLFLWYAQPNID